MPMPIRMTVANNNDQDHMPGNSIVPHNVNSTIIDLGLSLPYGELAKLYRNIETALPDRQCRVIQFVSAYKGEGASTVAFEMAVIAARMMGKRVLFIDTSASQASTSAILPEDVGIPLETMLLSGRPPYEALAQANGTELYLARLHERGENELPPASLNVMEEAIEHMKPMFDFIVIDSQGVLKDAFGIAFAKLADGSILVVEAERTRAPVVLETKRMLESGGGNVIGSVLSKRRFYIPKFLYRILYPHDEV
ncbi:MAG TPA: hypothetical protein VFT64_11410 [Rickettsiales bacterium]|nr:hypothetical protein [Rickettsiales bacterium]